MYIWNVIFHQKKYFQMKKIKNLKNTKKKFLTFPFISRVLFQNISDVIAFPDLSFLFHHIHFLSPVGWSFRIHQLHLCNVIRLRPPPNERPGYDIKQSDDEALVMPELWGMRSNSSLPSLSVPLWLGVVAPDRVISMGLIELFEI